MKSVYHFTSLWLLALWSQWTPSGAFPDGAPVDACVKPRPNTPYHGQARPQSQQTRPYSVVADTSYYAPGSVIAVRIEGQEPFKGFFLQGRDAASGEWVGEWLPTSNTTSLPECSAITHADPQRKLKALLVWRAPNNAPRNSQVYFTGTVLKDYGTFWSNIVADTGDNSLQVQ